MKKLFSISFALLILISGMHLSIATHFCAGEIAAVKCSFAGENASCGMEIPEQASQTAIAANCCQNEISTCAVDDSYNPTTFQIKEITKSVLQVFYVPLNLLSNSILISGSLNHNVIPPDIASVSSVSLDNICIFRI